MWAEWELAAEATETGLHCVCNTDLTEAARRHITKLHVVVIRKWDWREKILEAGSRHGVHRLSEILEVKILKGTSKKITVFSYLALSLIQKLIFRVIKYQIQYHNLIPFKARGVGFFRFLGAFFWFGFIFKVSKGNFDYRC